MALPSSGAISRSDINTNIGASPTATITMNDTPVRWLANGDTTTNPVTMQSLYGKSWSWATNVSLSSASTFSGYSIATDSNGNVYSSAVGTYYTNNLIIKTNPVGVVQWVRELSSTSGSYATPQGLMNSLAVDSSGNIYYGCSITETTSPPYDTWFGVVKLNSSGVVQWSAFQSAGVNFISTNNIGLDSSGNVYVCGFSTFFSGSATACLAKYNSSGTLLWQKTVGGLLAGGGSGHGGMFVDSTNNYVYLTGSIYTSYAYQGAYIGKFNTDLTPVWEKLVYATSGTQPSFWDCTVNSSTQNVHCLFGDPGVGAALFNSSGTLQWQQLQSAGGLYSSIGADSSGNTYVWTTTYPTPPLSSVVKYSSGGSITAQVKVTSTSASGGYSGPTTVRGSFLYGLQDTVTSANPINGGSIIKIPTSLSVSGTYGRVSFGSLSYTSSASSYSVTSTTGTVANSAFSFISNYVTSTDVTSSYTRTVTPI